jgi:hypothetical protein
MTTLAEQFVLHLGDMFPITQTCLLKEREYDDKNIQVAFLAALLQEPRTEIASSDTKDRVIAFLTGMKCVEDINRLAITKVMELIRDIFDCDRIEEALVSQQPG